MSLSIEIEVTDEVTPFLAMLEEGLTNRTDLHSYIAAQAETRTQDYLRAIAPRRHSTADRLGAPHSGHLTDAADSIESSHNAQSAVLTFPRTTGLSRAFRQFDLRPTGGKKWLAIPAIASAYNHSPREFDLSFVPFRDDLAALVTRSQSDRSFIVVYWLKKEITIEQDRTLLPDDRAYSESAELGAREFIRDLQT